MMMLPRLRDSDGRHRPDPDLSLRSEAGSPLSPLTPGTRGAAKVLLRVYHGPNGRWCVARDGARPDAEFKSRLAAIEFARLLGMAAGSYRMLLETSDGHLLEERFIPK